MKSRWSSKPSAAQLLLDFGSPLVEQRRPQRRAPSDLLFFAIFPGDAEAGRVRSTARRLSDRHELSGHLIRSERLHLTLKPVGLFDGIPDGVVAAAKVAASMVRASPFELTFGRSMRFNGGAFVLLCDEAPGLQQLQRDLVDALGEVGLGGRYAFNPHVTLAYEPHPIKGAPLATAPRDWRTD